MNKPDFQAFGRAVATYLRGLDDIWSDPDFDEIVELAVAYRIMRVEPFDPRKRQHDFHGAEDCQKGEPVYLWNNFSTEEP